MSDDGKTLEDLYAEIDEAQRIAHANARKLYGAGMIGPTSPIVDTARLVVLERIVVSMATEHTDHVGTTEQKLLMEMRDYWQEVAEEVAKR